MSAGNYDFTLEQNVDNDVELEYTDANDVAINLTGYTARMQARVTYSTPGTIFDISSGAGGIVLGDAAGTITFPGLTDTLTEAMDFDTGVFDLKLTDTLGLDDRLIQGVITFSRRVTE